MEVVNFCGHSYMALGDASLWPVLQKADTKQNPEPVPGMALPPMHCPGDRGPSEINTGTSPT